LEFFGEKNIRIISIKLLPKKTPKVFRKKNKKISITNFALKNWYSKHFSHTSIFWAFFQGCISLSQKWTFINVQISFLKIQTQKNPKKSRKNTLKYHFL